MVRLVDADIRNETHVLCEFQFLYGAIGGVGRVLLLITIISFNSYMVRLVEL